MLNLERLSARIQSIFNFGKKKRAGHSQETWDTKSGRVSKKLIVGLGNPGKEYSKNRHNIGFMAVDVLASRFGIEVKRKKHKAVYGKGTIGENQVILAKPKTFMNKSGEAVERLKNYYGINDEDTLLIYDEIDLPFGTIRIREKGGSGGHNGMKSVIGRIGQGFPRIRLGVGRPPGRMDPADYVLSDFKSDEWALVEEMTESAASAIELLLAEGLDIAMTHCNKTIQEI